MQPVFEMVNRNSQPVLEVVDLCHRYSYKTVDALSDFSLKIYSGDRIADLGISGSGKTTTVNLLTCQERVQKGSIVYCDGGGNLYEFNPHAPNRHRRITRKLSLQIRRQKIGYAHQDAHLWHYLSCQQNVAESLVLASRSIAERCHAPGRDHPGISFSRNTGRPRFAKADKQKRPMLIGRTEAQSGDCKGSGQVSADFGVG